MSKKLAVVIAHFDPDGHVPLDLLNLISALKKRSNEIVFVSTNINKKSALIVGEMCNLITRENYGYDFWSYKVGIESILNKKNLDSILLINSSVIYFNPDKLINKFFEDSPDSPALYGLTESYQIEQHVQSFWIEFCTNELINSKAFDVWWSEMLPISDQLEVIRKYEIGMSNYFKNLGVKLKALYIRSTGDQILAACRSIADDHYEVNLDQKLNETGNFSLPLHLAQTINPTSILWDIILRDYDWIKVKTFDRSNRDFRIYKFLKYLEKDIKNIDEIINIIISRKLNHLFDYKK